MSYTRGSATFLLSGGQTPGRAGLYCCWELISSCSLFGQHRFYLFDKCNQFRRICLLVQSKCPTECATLDGESQTVHVGVNPGASTRKGPFFVGSKQICLGNNAKKLISRGALTTANAGSNCFHSSPCSAAGLGSNGSRSNPSVTIRRECSRAECQSWHRLGEPRGERSAPLCRWQARTDSRARGHERVAASGHPMESNRPR